MEALEREMALRRIEDTFDEIGDEMLARIFLPNGLDGDNGPIDDVARALEEHGIPVQLWEAAVGDTKDPAEIQARCEEYSRRVIEPRRERIQYYARKMNENKGN